MQRGNDRRTLRRPVIEQSDEGVDVEMGIQKIGHQIELSIPSRSHIDVVSNDESGPARRGSRAGQPLPAEVVVVEQAVQCVPNI